MKGIRKVQGSRKPAGEKKGFSAEVRQKRLKREKIQVTGKRRDERPQDRRKATESKKVIAPAEWRVAHTNMRIQQKTTNIRTHTCTPALASTRTRTHTHSRTDSYAQ